MSIYEARKRIKVSEWYNNPDGIICHYWLDGNLKTYKPTPKELVEELKQQALIEAFWVYKWEDTEEIMVQVEYTRDNERNGEHFQTSGTTPMTLLEFMKEFSQWDWCGFLASYENSKPFNNKIGKLGDMGKMFEQFKAALS